MSDAPFNTFSFGDPMADFKMPGWIGVDLDGTLAEYTGWRGVDHIGKPVPLMVARIKRWLDRGWEVRIFTARMSEINKELRSSGSSARARKLIQRWLVDKAGLPKLEVTNQKDYEMIALWDDRAVQVIENTGEVAMPQEMPLFDDTPISTLRRAKR